MAEPVGRGPGFLHVPHRSAVDPQRMQSNWSEVERVVNSIVPGAATVYYLGDEAEIAGDGTATLSVALPASIPGLAFGSVNVSVSGTDLADDALVSVYLNPSPTAFRFAVVDGAGQFGVPQAVAPSLTVSVSVKATGATTGTAEMAIAWIQ